MTAGSGSRSGFSCTFRAFVGEVCLCEGSVSVSSGKVDGIKVERGKDCCEDCEGFNWVAAAWTGREGTAKSLNGGFEAGVDACKSQLDMISR